MNKSNTSTSTSTSVSAVNNTSLNNSKHTSSSSSILAIKSHSTPSTAITIENGSAGTGSLLPNINSSSSLGLPNQALACKEGDSLNSFLLNVVKEFNEKIQRMRLDFQRQVTELHELISQLLNRITDKHDVDEHGLRTQRDLFDIDLRLDTIERDKHSNMIVIDGIPISNISNDLPAVFNSLCTSANITVPSYSDIFSTKRNTSNDSGSIVVNLHRNKDKRNVLQAIRAKIKSQGQLTLRNIGLNSDQRIYVHESLTKRNYRIFREALKLKKKGNFCAVFTTNGRVFAKVNTESQPQYIRSIDDIARISGPNV